MTSRLGTGKPRSFFYSAGVNFQLLLLLWPLSYRVNNEYLFFTYLFFSNVFILCSQLALPPSIEDRLLALEGDKDQLHLQVIIRKQVSHLYQQVARCRSGWEKSRSHLLTKISFNRRSIWENRLHNLFTKWQGLTSLAGQYVRVSNTSWSLGDKD